MPQPRPSYLDAHSGGQIRVGKTTDPTRLASSIVQALLDERNRGRIQVRACGLEPVNIKSKAIIIASGHLYQRGKAFLRIDTFDTIRTPDGFDLTVLVANLVLVEKGDLDRLNVQVGVEGPSDPYRGT